MEFRNIKTQRIKFRIANIAYFLHILVYKNDTLDLSFGSIKTLKLVPKMDARWRARVRGV